MGPFCNFFGFFTVSRARVKWEKVSPRRGPARPSAIDLVQFGRVVMIASGALARGFKCQLEKKFTGRGAGTASKRTQLIFGFVSSTDLRYKRQKKPTMILTSGQKAARTRRLRAAGRKAAITRKRRAAGRKAAKTRMRRAAARKAAATRKRRANLTE